MFLVTFTIQITVAIRTVIVASVAIPLHTLTTTRREVASLINTSPAGFEPNTDDASPIRWRI